MASCQQSDVMSWKHFRHFILEFTCHQWIPNIERQLRYFCIFFVVSSNNVLNKQLSFSKCHYGDVIMGEIASQITSLTIVYSAVYSGTDQREHKKHRGPVNSPHKWPVTRKCFHLMTSSWSRLIFGESYQHSNLHNANLTILGWSYLKNENPIIKYIWPGSFGTMACTDWSLQCRHMSVMASQITGHSSVSSTVCLC